MKDPIHEEHDTMLNEVLVLVEDAGLKPIYREAIKEEVLKFRRAVDESDSRDETWQAHTRMIGQVMTWLDEGGIKSVYKRVIKSRFYAFYDSFIDEGPRIPEQH